MYDWYNFKTKAACESRLKELRSKYNDMNLSNTKCSAVRLPQCPPKTVYRIFIIDRGAGTLSKDVTEPSQDTSASEFALAC